MIELAFHNFYYNSFIGQEKNNDTFAILPNTSFGEKVLKLSNSYTHIYKIIIQIISLNKPEAVMEKDPKYYLKYAFKIIILNLLKLGESTLAISFMKKYLNFLFLNESNIYNFKCSIDSHSIETINTTLLLLFEVLEFDFNFAIKNIWSIITSNPTIDISLITNLNCLKLFSLSGRGDLNKYITHTGIEEHNFYYSLLIKYLKFVSQSAFDCDKLHEMQILEYKKLCKKHNFNKFKLLANLLISKILISKENYTGALFILNKVILKAKDESTRLKAHLLFAQIYSKTDKYKELENTLHQNEDKVELYGDINDKFEYYSIKSQILYKLYFTNQNEVLNPTTSLSLPIINMTKKCLYKCLENAISTNCIDNIETSLYILRVYFKLATDLNLNQSGLNFVMIEEMIHQHVNKTNKLFDIFCKFSLDNIQKLELIKIVNDQNVKTSEVTKQFFLHN